MQSIAKEINLKVYSSVAGNYHSVDALHFITHPALLEWCVRVKAGSQSEGKKWTRSNTYRFRGLYIARDIVNQPLESMWMNKLPKLQRKTVGVKHMCGCLHTCGYVIGVRRFSFSFSIVSLSSLRSSLVPTRMMGVLGQWWLTSGYHCNQQHNGQGQQRNDKKRHQTKTTYTHQQRASHTHIPWHGHSQTKLDWLERSRSGKHPTQFIKSKRKFLINQSHA